MTSPDATSLADLRRSYARAGLSEADAAADPIAQVRTWLADARAADLVEPNAMTLATADADGRPSARTVLLKGLDDRGFVLFTNRTSRKGRELAANPRASLVLAWVPLERQVIVVGDVVEVSADETEAYVHSRPRGSQLAAWASRQSQVVGSREELDAAYDEVAARWADVDEVPVPDFWGGYRVQPLTVELWQGRENRLHDRLRYRRSSVTDTEWVLERLNP